MSTRPLAAAILLAALPGCAANYTVEARNLSDQVVSMAILQSDRPGARQVAGVVGGQDARLSWSGPLTGRPVLRAARWESGGAVGQAIDLSLPADGSAAAEIDVHGQTILLRNVTLQTAR